MKKNTFDELMTSIEQGGTILKGKKLPSRKFNIDDPDVPEIRRHLGLTQEKFAMLLGISLATLRNWEQGRRKPEGPARILLCIVAKHPKTVLEAVHA
jgi:putative transcriptional regulator